MAASEPVCDSAALGGGLALLLEWEMWPSEGLCLPSLGQVFTHCRKRGTMYWLYLWQHIKQNHQEMNMQNYLQ